MIILASLSSFSEASHHLVGFLFVVFILSLLWVLTEAIGFYFKSVAAKADATRPVRVKPKPPVQSRKSAATSADISEEEVAAITACIMTVLGKNSRIVSIRSGNATWGQEGRRDHFASHRIR